MAGSAKKRTINLQNSFFDNFFGAAIEYKTDFSVTSIMGEVKELTGYSEESLIIGNPFWSDIIHPEDNERIKTDLKANIKKNPNYSGQREYRIIRKDGQVQMLSEQLQCTANKKGELVTIKGLVFEKSGNSDNRKVQIKKKDLPGLINNDRFNKEIQKRKRAEAEFLKEKEFLHKILDSFSYPFFVIDAETHQIVLSNKTAKSFYGKEKLTCYELSHKKNSPCDKTCLCPLKTVKTTKEPCLTEHIHFDLDNNPRYFAVHGFPIFNEEGEVSQIIEYSFETTEQRKAELAVRESEEKYRLLFDNERDAIILLDVESHRIIDCNKTAIELYQYEKAVLLTMEVQEISAEPEETIEAINAGETGESNKIDLRWHKKKDGAIFPVEISVGFFDWKGRKTICAIIRDISERREREEEQSRLEKRLTATQKMHAIGTLAGGIAHDFNNLLFAQIGYLEMALGKLAKDHICYNYVDESLKASLRAADLVKQILNFSRSDHVSTEPINIAPILKETVKMLGSSVSSNISMKTDIDVECHNVIGNPVQIQQLILNICSNAEYAMRNTGGELYFELKEKPLTQKEAKSFGFEGAGTYVSLIISDTGVGMESDVKEHIFEPYFTTKPYWQGGGMGLAVVHGIVENNMEGVISVDSLPGKGSRFRMLFPALVEGMETPKSAFIEEKKKVLRNQVAVLFIDDEQMICKMGKTILGNMGYHVITHTDPIDAITAFNKDFQYIDLVITDQIMPGMTGIQLAREITAIKPGIRIILMSANKLALKEDKLQEIGILQTISKPVSKHILAKAIDNVLKNSSELRT